MKVSSWNAREENWKETEMRAFLVSGLELCIGKINMGKSLMEILSFVLKHLHTFNSAQLRSTYLARMFSPNSQCQCSHKWSGSSHPCRLHYSYMGSCHIAWYSGGSRRTWHLLHSVPLPAAGCSCFARRWTNLGYSQRSHNSALLSRAQWEGWVLPGSLAAHPGTCHPPDLGSHSLH